MRWPSERNEIGFAAVAIIVFSLLAGMGSVRAQSFMEQPVDFGVPRTQVVDGLDVEFACRVVVTGESVTVLDSAEASVSIGLAPGRCAITLHILGVAVPVPLLNLTPLGRLQISIPGVAGFTFGLADVSIDLVTGLSANYTGTSSAVTPSPTEMAWSQWGAKSVTMSAHAGGEGNSLLVAIPYTFWMTLAIGVSVLVLGVPVYSVNLVDVGTFQGTPAVAVPVTVDRRPSRVATVEGWAPSAETVQVNWTPNQDSDFASYRVRLADGASSYVFAVDTQGASTLTMPAARGTDYTVSVFVVDRAGQTSVDRSVQVRTPGTSAPSPPVQGLDPILLGLAAVGAFAAGFGIAWSLRGRRAR